jgi:hypothetical protein
MFNWLRRRRLSAAAQKKLMILHARAEEAVITTHVSNILELLETLEEEIDLERGLEIYMETMSLDDATAATVTTRLLAQLEGPDPESDGYRNVFRG